MFTLLRPKRRIPMAWVRGPDNDNSCEPFIDEGLFESLMRSLGLRRTRHLMVLGALPNSRHTTSLRSFPP